MPNRKQIIIITVLGILTLMLGCKPKANPVKTQPLTPRTLTLEEKRVVGTYEKKFLNSTLKYIFLHNGMGKLDGGNPNRPASKFKWSIVDGEIHINHPNNIVHVWRLNPDNSISHITSIYQGSVRRDRPKENQTTFKKIN